MTTQALKIYRETALPSTLEPYAIYMIAPASTSTYVEMYVTSSTGVARRIINKADIDALIATAVTAATELMIVDNYPDLLLITPPTTKYAYVVDATGDSTVTAGGATYLYYPNPTLPTLPHWMKVSESESLDVVLEWANIQNKPTSAVADIDDAVAKRHSHANKTQLDKISEDTNGNLLYSSGLPHTGWDSTTW